MEIYAQPFTVAEKADASPVTQADHHAEAIIVARLRRAAPEMALQNWLCFWSAAC